MPTRPQLHVDTPLTDISVAFWNKESSFVAGSFAPALPVKFQSNKYYVYDKGDFLRDEADLRGPGAVSAGTHFAKSTESYDCEVYAVHKTVSDQDRGNDDMGRLLADATAIVTQKCLIKRERLFMDAVFGQSKWTNEGAPSTKWDNTSGNPIKDIATQIDNIIGRVGCLKSEIKLLLAPNTARGIFENADVKDRIKYTQMGIADEQLLRTALGIGEVKVARAIYNTADRGQTASTSNIATSEGALLCYVPSAPSIMTPSAMYNFVWTGYEGANTVNGPSIFSWYANEKRSNIVEAEIALDFKITSQDAAYYFYDTLT